MGVTYYLHRHVPIHWLSNLPILLWLKILVPVFALTSLDFVINIQNISLAHTLILALKSPCVQCLFQTIRTLLSEAAHPLIGSTHTNHKRAVPWQLSFPSNLTFHHWWLQFNSQLLGCRWFAKELMPLVCIPFQFVYFFLILYVLNFHIAMV